MQIHKFPIPTDEEDFVLKFSASHEILSFQLQNNIPVAWILVDEKAPLIKHLFSVYKTGQQIDIYDQRNYEAIEKYIATIQTHEGCVLHLFKKVR